MSFFAFLFWEPFGLVALWVLLIAFAPFLYLLGVVAPWIRLVWHLGWMLSEKVAAGSNRLAIKLGHKLGVYDEHGHDNY